MDYNQIAIDIIEHVGGSGNIISAMHCATRLRLRLRDYDQVNEEALTDVDQVKGVFLANDQYQIILGSGTVNLVTDEVLKETGLGSGFRKLLLLPKRRAMRSHAESKFYRISLFRSFRLLLPVVF